MKGIDKHKLFIEAETIRRNGQDLVLSVKAPKNKEVIIVSNKDITEKIKYIDSAYDFNLDHRRSEGVSIVGMTDLENWILKMIPSLDNLTITETENQ